GPACRAVWGRSGRWTRTHRRLVPQSADPHLRRLSLSGGSLYHVIRGNVTFSGYVAADELYEGPSCVLSAVDNRQYKRILYAVLAHDPTHDDITAFLGRLKSALVDRGLALQGITTDGSPLYPEPLRTVLGAASPQ